MTTTAFDLEGKSQLMIDFIAVKEQTNEYRSNILELLENDNNDSEILHYNEILQYLNHYTQLSEHSLQRQEEQIQTIQELNSWKCMLEEQMNQYKTRMNSLENDCQNYEKRLLNQQQEIQSGEQDLKNCQDELRVANEAIRNYQAKCDELDKEIERMKIKNQTVNNEHGQQLAQSSANLDLLERQIQEYKDLEMDKIREINELKQVNLEWEQKTKEILHEIQQNDLHLEKKEYERNLQFDEMYQMIAQQQEEIDTLQKQLQHQARKEQAALVHAKLNVSTKAMSFVGISGGQSFIMPNQTQPLVTPSKLQRVNSSDKLTEPTTDQQARTTVTSPEKMNDIENELQGINEGERKKCDVIQMNNIELKADTYSMPGSLIEQSGETIENNNSPVCADDGYRSQNSDDDVAEVNVELVEEQGRGDGPAEAVGETPQGKTPGNIGLRRDPEEEFFMLAILALKMQYSENQDAEFIYQIDSQKLFEQVKQIKLPFHKWYSWIDTKFAMMKIAFEQEQEDLYNDPVKNPEGLVNPYKRNEESTKSNSKAEDNSPFGIFDKIKNFLNRQTSDEKEEEEERKEKERRDRQKLLGGNSSTGFGLRQNFQYKTMRSKNFSQFQKPILSTKSEEIFMLGQPFNMKKNFFTGDQGGSTSNGTILSAGSDTMTTKWNFIDA